MSNPGYKNIFFFFNLPAALVMEDDVSAVLAQVSFSFLWIVAVVLQILFLLPPLIPAARILLSSQRQHVDHIFSSPSFLSDKKPVLRVDLGGYTI